MKDAVLKAVHYEHKSAGLLARLRHLRYQGRRIDWVAYLFVLPFCSFFAVMTIVPIVFGLYVSFTEWSITEPPKWIGFANYQRLLVDDWVPKVWGNNLKMAALIVPGVVIIALLVALYVNERLPLAGMVRTAFYAPHVVAISVTALVWVWILEKETGVLNIALSSLGLPKTSFLTSVTWVIPSIASVSIWGQTGYYMVILLAGLQGIPPELKDAARIDGGSGWHVFWHVVLPLLRPALVLVITLAIIAGFRIFGSVYLMTQGGPGGRSSSIVHYIYTTGFQNFRLGYAAALSVALFATILFFALLRVRLFRELEY